MNRANHEKLLKRVTTVYSNSFQKSEQAKLLCDELGLRDTRTLKTFSCGYADGSLLKMFPADGEIAQGLKDLGITNGKATERMLERLVIPIYDTRPTIKTLVGIGQNDEKVTNDTQDWFFNQQGLATYKEIVLVDSVYEALLLWQAGVKNIIAAHQITEWHQLQLKRSRVKSVMCFKKEFEEFVPEMHFQIVAIPEGQTSAQFIKANNDETIQMLLSAPEEKKNTPQREIEDGFIYESHNRVYTVRGIEQFTNRLRANIKVQKGRQFHIDTIDLYSAKQRRQFLHDATMFAQDSADLIEQDLTIIIEKAEKYVALRKGDASAIAYSMTDEERREALAFAEQPDLMEQISKDITAHGYVAEEHNKLICYLAMASRKIKDPLNMLIISGSGAGKSTLQDTTLSFCPKEDLIKLTALSGKALFYKRELSLQNKVLAIEEQHGAEEADYAIRSLISAHELSIETTMRDPVTGKLTVMRNTVKANTAVFKTTTNPEVEPETKSRFIVISVDESREQTRRILEHQRFMETREGYQATQNRDTLLRKHHNFQRLLKPVRVFNPFARLLTYQDDHLMVRRDHPKYIAIIRVITFLHQFQRPVKTLDDGTEYIEVTLDDIAMANEIAHSLLGHSLDELSEPSRRLLKILHEMVNKESSPSCKATFTRKQIREYSKWSDYQVHTHLKQLVNLEYVLPLFGGNGRQYRYELLYNGEHEHSNRFFTGLKPFEKLKQEATALGLA